MMRWVRPIAAAWCAGSVVLVASCARPLLGPDIDGGSDESSGDDAASESTTLAPDEPEPQPEPVCHASYQPCLPIVDDLDCADVRDAGLAPVTVVGDDAYGLDADGDGLGCE